jgi:hypothetical protein
MCCWVDFIDLTISRDLAKHFGQARSRTTPIGTPKVR